MVKIITRCVSEGRKARTMRSLTHVSGCESSVKQIFSPSQPYPPELKRSLTGSSRLADIWINREADAPPEPQSITTRFIAVDLAAAFSARPRNLPICPLPCRATDDHRSSRILRSDQQELAIFLGIVSNETISLESFGLNGFVFVLRTR